MFEFEFERVTGTPIFGGFFGKWFSFFCFSSSNHVSDSVGERVIDRARSYNKYLMRFLTANPQPITRNLHWAEIPRFELRRASNYEYSTVHLLHSRVLLLEFQISLQRVQMLCVPMQYCKIAVQPTCPQPSPGPNVQYKVQYNSYSTVHIIVKKGVENWTTGTVSWDFFEDERERARVSPKRSGI